MPFIASRSSLISGPVCFDNFVDITDEALPDFPIQRMELLRRAARQTKLLVRKRKKSISEEKGLFPNISPQTSVMSSERSLLNVQVPRSRSLDVGALTPISLPLYDTTSKVTSSSVKRLSLEGQNLSKRGLLFPFSLSKERNMSVESFSSDETCDTQTSGDFSDRFHVVLYNKFGTQRDDAAGILDAKSVSHVYSGAVLVTDMLDSKVVLYERSGKAKRTYMTRECTEPWGATMTPEGQVAVSFRRQRCVAVWPNDGQTIVEVGHGLLKCPAGVAVDKTGRIIVADEEADDVLVFDQTGKSLFKLSDLQETCFKQPRYVCCSISGRIIVSDSGNHCIKVFNQSGEFLFKFGCYGRGNGQFKFPYGVCADQHDNIFVADHYNDRVVMFSSKGGFIQDLVTSDSGLRNPAGLSVRCAHNRKLYITHGELRASEVIVFKLIPEENDVSINVKYYV
ncbi:tripartite motif-containing protein 2-like [Haliotis cracherodii]|uniref:tripartite motif-containing protein 2-like n=1 Tax=Haliotis cracherodii TaxID=6455 RepID=UPI0039EB9628